MIVKMPIFLFDYKYMGLDFTAFKSNIASCYDEFEIDLYLLHKIKIDFLYQNNILDNKDYKIDITSLDLPSEILKTLDSFVSNRKRLIAECRIRLEEENFKIERVPSSPFIQTYANSLEALDYRHEERKFKELPDRLFDENLIRIIKFIFLEIFSFLVRHI